jgi:hypothetical protein
MPSHQSNTGDTREGGAMRAHEISSLVATAEGESGNGSEGTSLNMMAISGVRFFFGVGRRSFLAKNKEESKTVNVD